MSRRHAAPCGRAYRWPIRGPIPRRLAKCWQSRRGALSEGTVARNPRSPSPICRGSGMAVPSPICRGSGVHPHRHARFAGDRGSIPTAIPDFARMSTIEYCKGGVEFTRLWTTSECRSRANTSQGGAAKTAPHANSHTLPLVHPHMPQLVHRVQGRLACRLRLMEMRISAWRCAKCADAKTLQSPSAAPWELCVLGIAGN